jgi:hypothetical protein
MSQKLNAAIAVNRVVLTGYQPLPVYPDQRTSTDRPSWSVPYKKRPLGAGVSGEPSIRISLMSTGPWQAIAPYTKKLKR